jgi:hypothetical protein
VVVVLAMVTELQEQLLVSERELDSHENTLMAREDYPAATKRTLGRARLECDTECDRAKAVLQDYRARMHISTTGCRCSLDFDRVLRGCQLILTVQGMDLEWWEEKFAEEHARSLYSFDGRDLSVEMEEQHERVARVQNECAAEAVQLSWLILEISDALVDLGVFPTQDIPVQLRQA